MVILIWAGMCPAHAVQQLGGLRQLASDAPREALTAVDSLYQEVVYPHYKLDYIKGCAYFRLSMFTQALHAAEDSYYSVEIQTDTAMHAKVFMLLAESAVFSYSIDKAARYIQQGKIYASRVGDDVLMANMLNAEGYLYRRLGLNRKSYECTLNALGLLTKAGGKENSFYLSRAYGYLMRYYVDDGKYQEAWQMGMQRNKVLADLEGMNGFDNQCGYQYSKLAYLATLRGKTSDAEMYYEKFMQTDFSKTFVGQLEINDYLLAHGQYDRVLSNARAYTREMDRRDTLNISYVRMLQQACAACEAEKNYHQAYLLAKRRLTIQLAMRTNTERNLLLGSMNLLDEVDGRQKMKQLEGDMVLQGRFLVVLSVLAAVLLGFLVVFFTVNRMLHRKNRKLSEALRRQVLQHEEELRRVTAGLQQAAEGQELPAEPAGGKMPEAAEVVDEVPADRPKDLFEVFHTRVCREKLYLNYALGRDDYARLMGVDKNRFASVLKEAGVGNLTAYLNGLRLDYSEELLKNHPDWAMSKVAEQCGLPNLSTFYRLFKEKFGTSPTVFKNQQGGKEEEDS